MSENSEEKYREVFENIIKNTYSSLTLLDRDGQIIFASPVFLKDMAAVSSQSELGSVFDMVEEEDIPVFREVFDKLVKGEDVSGRSAAEFRMCNVNHSCIYVEGVFSNLLDYKDINAVLVVYRDLTSHKFYLNELENYKSTLEERVEQRTQELTESLEKEKEVIEQQKNFITMVSHEFRTPLTIIDGNAQIIQGRGATLTQEILQKRALTIRQAVDRLVGLIERVLSGKVLETGDLEAVLGACDFSSLVRGLCIERLGISPEAKISLDIQRNIPKMMLDEKLMNQLFINLLSNAFKYSGDEPEIKVSMYMEGDTHVVLEVSDKGVGIPEDELEKIFTKYFRASTSAKIPGTGLGLNLVRKIADLHNGEVFIESEVDFGTTLTVKLPVVLVQESANIAEEK